MKETLLSARTLFMVLLMTVSCSTKDPVIFCGSTQNEVYAVLKGEGFRIVAYDSPDKAIAEADDGMAVFIMAEKYPAVDHAVSEEMLRKAKEKKLRLYIEYPAAFPGLDIPEQPVST